MTQRLTLEQIAANCSRDGVVAMPMPPGADGDKTFAEPWQAHAFALTLLLHERGVFTWRQWAETLAGQIRRARLAGVPDDGTSYYRHWLDALEQLVIGKQLASAEQLHELEHAWEAAAARTPHGQPIELSAADRRRRL